MTIKVEIIASSVAPNGKKITTVAATYPRFIHAELMTHRVFSRNASSSRAIPVSKLIEQVQTDPAMPLHWGKNQAGMQAHEETDEPIFIMMPDLCSLGKYTAEQAWLRARDEAVNVAKAFETSGYHKQVVNRILEPFVHITTLITSTEWDNFFSLRRHPDAQPEIKVLADKIFEAMYYTAPQYLNIGEWHLPFIGKQERLTQDEALKASAARCARVSYLNHDGSKPNLKKDLALFDQLINSKPAHASPVEHQATPLRNPCESSRNFRGWYQQRAYRGV